MSQTTTEVAGVYGLSIEPRIHSSGATTWHWRAWLNHALEANACDTYDAAVEAVDEAHARMRESKEEA